MVQEVNSTVTYQVPPANFTFNNPTFVVPFSSEWFRLYLIQGFICFCFVCYAACIVLGIPCNIFVISRMCRLTARCTEVRNGSGVCLLIMSVADIVSLTTTGIHLVSANVEFSYSARNVICKIVLFSTHFATSVSIWCWLMLSTLRYLSIHHPFIYIRIWTLPLRILSAVVTVAFIMNLWLLFVVGYGTEEKKCVVKDLFSAAVMKQAFLLVEMTWSFCIPSAVIIYADATALYCWIKLTKIQKDSRKNKIILRRNCSSKNKTLTRRPVWRWLFLALIDVLLNAPENIFRFCAIVGIITDSTYDTIVYYMLRISSQVLYYSQFGLNCVYLALFIYDNNAKHSDRGAGTCNAVKVTGREHSTGVEFPLMSLDSG